MTAWILKFEDIGSKDVDMAGGKGANLGELTGKGFPVPPGFVVSADAYETFFKNIDFHEALDGLPDLDPEKQKDRCEKIQRLIHRAEISAGLEGAILEAHTALAEMRSGEIVCAVRSSATAEDLGDASFAGQHATYYYVERNRLLSMVKHCWASLWHPEAMCYRATHGIEHASVLMAVVVQEMIPSEISGVTFTANPVSGSRDEIVTESSWGMGAAIVDGRVTPDHYVAMREDFGLREKRIAEKRCMVPPRLTEGTKTRLQEVPHDLRQKETLSADMVKAVSELALKAEEHFGCPQDIEWAITGDRVYMLQSRPITVMGREDIGQDVTEELVIFKPLLENFTDPVTPLTGDCYQFLFTPPLMQLIKGWLYVNVRAFRAVLPFRTSNEELASLLYDFGTQSPEMKLSPVKLPFMLIFMFIAYLTAGVFCARTRGLPGNFMDGYRKLARQVDRDPRYGIIESFKRLLWWTKFFDPAGNQVMAVNLTAPRYFLFLGLLESLLNRWLPNLGEDAAALLCSGTEGVLSAEMGRGIWALAKEAKKNRIVREILEQNQPGTVLTKLKQTPEAKAFLAELDRFLAKNGHRGLKELELRSPRWEEDPTPVLGMVRNYMLVDSDPGRHEKKVEQVRSDLEKEIQANLASCPLERQTRFRWRLIRRMAHLTKYYARTRENSRFYHTMGFYILRKKILRLEEDLIQKGELKCKDDIFFLHLRELLQMQKGALGWQDVEEIIRSRRMEHIRLSKTAPPKSINIKLKEAPSVDAEAMDDGLTFKGQPASPGTYEGLAHIILDPSIDVELKPGEILVAPYTDPAWTPLFLTAGAAVVEVGSYLSHAGTVAREFGMPCVVDLPDCTKQIQTGFKIQVDGDRGIVRLLGH